jgi:hypothetical protein
MARDRNYIPAVRLGPFLLILQDCVVNLHHRSLQTGRVIVGAIKLLEAENELSGLVELSSVAGLVGKQGKREVGFTPIVDTSSANVAVEARFH